MDPAIQSALISAFVGILVLRVNYKMNKRSVEVQREIANQNIDANITAKARLKWINEVREIVLELISSSIDVDSSIRQIIDIQKKEELVEKNEIKAHYYSESELKEKNEKDIHKFFEIANGRKKDMEKQKLLLALYFSKNKENNDIINKAMDVDKQTHDIYDVFIKLSNGSINLAEADFEIKLLGNRYENTVNTFINCIREYTKKEWEKAKTGR